MAIAKKLLQQRLNANTLTYSGLAGLLANLMSGCGDPPPAKPDVNFSNKTYTVSEDQSEATVTVTLTHAAEATVKINVNLTAETATDGLDYTTLATMLTFSPGELTKTFKVPITNDALDEADETVKLSLSRVTTNVDLELLSTTRLTITDNDDPPTVAFTKLTSSGDESVSPKQLNVELSAISGQDVSVIYTVSGTAAGSAADYSLIDGTLIINAGEDSATITIDNIIDDAELEDDETVIVDFSNPINATLGTNKTHTYTIIDNDDTTAPTASAAARFHFIDQTTIDYENNQFNGEAAVYFSSTDGDIKTVTLMVGETFLVREEFSAGKATVVIPEATFISEIKDSPGSHTWNNLTYNVSDSSGNTSQTASIVTTTSFLTATSGDKVAFIDYNSDDLYSVGETVYATLDSDNNSALDGASMSAVLDGVIGAMDSSTLDNISATALKTATAEIPLSYSSSNNLFSTNSVEINVTNSDDGNYQVFLYDYDNNSTSLDLIRDFSGDSDSEGYDAALDYVNVSSANTSDSDFLDILTLAE